jgi:catechol 2,3-dioxygenase-like lactoylglutathione lyase family enzyme
MLTGQILKAFIPTVHPDKARLFYTDVLGLKFLSGDKYGSEFDSNGTILRISTVEKLTPQPFTVLGWNVDNIVSKIKSLNKKGVVFEKYEFLDQDTYNIWTAPGGTRVAWFKDPDGNLLSLTQE